MVKYWLHNGLMRAAAAGKGGWPVRSGKAEEADSNTKISRSKGAGGLADLIRRQGGERLRFFLLRTHYRTTIVFSEEGIQEAGGPSIRSIASSPAGIAPRARTSTNCRRLRSRCDGEFDPQGDPFLAEVAERRRGYLAKMDDDFNTGGAVSELFELVRVLNRYMDQHGLDQPRLSGRAGPVAGARQSLRSAN